MLDTWLIVVIVVGCVVFVLGMVVLFVVTRHLRRQKGKDTKTAGERSPKVAPASPTSSLPTGSRSVDNPVFGRSSVHFGNTPPAEAAGASEPESQFGFTDDQLEEVVVPEPKRPGDDDSGAEGAESGVSSAAEPSTGAAQEVNDSKRASDADQATPVANGTSQHSQEQASESGESREDRKSKLAAMRAARERKRQEEWQELEESLRVIDEIYNSEI